MTPASTKKNHNLAVIAITLALLATFMATSPFVWLLLPAVICSLFAWRDLNKYPQRYSGKIFVLATWLLSLAVTSLYLFMLLN